MIRSTTALLALLMVSAGHAVENSTPESGPHWRTWSPEVFEQAQRDGRLVLVDLVADWCSFCKKMDHTTYRDPAVLDAIDKNYIPVRADPEKQPQLPPRFADYGRPSTVILAPDGSEVLRKQGYLKPQWMLWTLQAVALEQSGGGQ